MDPGLKPRALLGAYLAAVLAISFVHEPPWLAAGLAAALLLSGRRRVALMRRALLSVLAFNATVSVGYALVAGWQGTFSADYLLLVNLRVLLLVFLGFWFVSRVDLAAAVSFSPALSFVVTVAVGQIHALKRVARDFRLAFASRNPERPAIADRARLAVAQGQHLLEKSVHAAGEVEMAMRSRGCFDD
jgi:cobalt/nickel transport system permease protein